MLSAELVSSSATDHRLKSGFGVISHVMTPREMAQAPEFAFHRLDIDTTGREAQACLVFTGNVDTSHLANNPSVSTATSPDGDLTPDGKGGYSLTNDAQPYWDDCSTRDAVALSVSLVPAP